MAQRILIVDDEADFSTILKTTLSSKGYLVEAAFSGKEAIGAYIHSLYNKRPIDLILLDNKMPDILGIEVLEILRDEERHRGITKGSVVPIIIMTAHDQPWMDPSLIKGTGDYIVKSDSIEEIVARIKKRLS
jgi:DNA-binding response OmpR family regulator